MTDTDPTRYSGPPSLVRRTIGFRAALRLVWLYAPPSCPYCGNPDVALWHEVGLPKELFETPLWYCGCREDQGGYFTLEEVRDAD